MLTSDPTCAALALASAHFDGLTADGSDCTAHKAKQGCSCAPKLAIHANTLWRAEAALFGVWLALAQVYSWVNMFFSLSREYTRA